MIIFFCLFIITVFGADEKQNGMKKTCPPKKEQKKKEKTGENILFWEKGLTLYVGYGMNDVDDVCQVGGQKNKTDRGAETISNPLEEMLDGRRGERGIRRSSGAGPMAPGLGRSRICGGLSLLWSAIKKK